MFESTPSQRVVLTRIHHGSAHQNRIYGTLLDAATGTTLMIATLDVILDAVQVRGLVLVKAPDAA